MRRTRRSRYRRTAILAIKLACAPWKAAKADALKYCRQNAQSCSVAFIDDEAVGGPALALSCQALLRHKRAPAAEAGNIARAVDRLSLDQKAFDAAAVVKLQRADRQGLRNGGDKAAKGAFRKRPYLDLDGDACTVFHAQQTGLGWFRPGKRIEAIVRRRRGLARRSGRRRRAARR